MHWQTLKAKWYKHDIVKYAFYNLWSQQSMKSLNQQPRLAQTCSYRARYYYSTYTADIHCQKTWKNNSSFKIYFQEDLELLKDWEVSLHLKKKKKASLKMLFCPLYCLYYHNCIWKLLIAVIMPYIILKATKEKSRWKKQGVSHATTS